MTQAPKIYVINVASSSNRRDFMRDQLDGLNVKYEFFSAVHGAQNPDHYLFKKYNDKKRAQLRGSGSPLRLSQLGCFASHYLLWEKCIQENTRIIILEDDAIVLPPFIQFYERATEFSSKYGLVWLQPSRKIANQTGVTIDQIGPFSIKKFAKGFAGTTGYLITPETARTLMGYCSEWIYPVDNTMDRFYDHKIEAIGLDPVCVTQDDDFESFINIASPGLKRSFADTARREYANLKDNVKRVTHNVMFYTKHKLR